MSHAVLFETFIILIIEVSNRLVNIQQFKNRRMLAKCRLKDPTPFHTSGDTLMPVVGLYARIELKILQLNGNFNPETVKRKKVPLSSCITT